MYITIVDNEINKVVVTLDNNGTVIPNNYIGGSSQCYDAVMCSKYLLYADGIGSVDYMNDDNGFGKKTKLVTTGTVGGGVVTANVTVYNSLLNVVIPIQSIPLDIYYQLSTSPLPIDSFYWVHTQITNSYGNIVEFYERIYITASDVYDEDYGAVLQIVGDDFDFNFTHTQVIDNSGTSYYTPNFGSYEAYLDGNLIIPSQSPISGGTVSNISIGSHILKVDWWYGVGGSKPPITSYKTSNIIVDCN